MTLNKNADELFEKIEKLTGIARRFDNNKIPLITIEKEELKKSCIISGKDLIRSTNDLGKNLDTLIDNLPRGDFPIFDDYMQRTLDDIVLKLEENREQRINST